MLSKIRKGDKVIVLSGKDAGRIGKVLRILPAGKEGKTFARAVVEDVNVVTKTVKRDPQRGVEGGFEKKPMPIALSNIAYYCEESKKPTKIGVKVLPNGEKKRYNRRLNKEVD